MLYLWRALSILFEAMHPFKRRNRYQQIARVRQAGKGHAGGKLSEHLDLDA
jgi:hypothetical protein